MTRFAGSFSLVLLAVLAPLVVTAVPPLHDYPFHLARADILASLPTSAFLRAHYEQGSFLLPNVGMDVVMVPLTRLLPILLAGRVFLGLTLISMLTGTIALHAALHRRLSTWPLAGAFFLYNWIFLYGFVNYLLGVGLMLWATAGWVMLRDRNAIWRLAWATIMATALMFCHLAAFGLFAVVIAGMELQRAAGALQINRWATLYGLALSALPFVIALGVFVAVSPAAPEVHEVMSYHGGRGWKLLVAYRSLLTTIDWLDGLTLSPLLAVIVVLVLRRRLRLASPMTVPLCLLVLAFAVMPFYLFGSQFGDARLPVAILLVAIASTSIVGLSRRTTWWIGLAALALLAVRSAAIARDWIDSDARIAAFTEAFRLIPDGATLYAATTAPYPSMDYRGAAGLALWHPPLKHVVSLASLGRDVFVPSTWSDPFKQPLRVVASMAPIKDFHGDNPFKTPSTVELGDIVREIGDLRAELPSHPGVAVSPHDYLLLLYPERLHGDLPPRTEVIARDVDFVLLRLS